MFSTEANLYFFFFQLWYQLSKILAENAAWRFSKDHGIDMIAINPGVVIGPILQPSPTSSAGVILDLANGMLRTICRLLSSQSKANIVDLSYLQLYHALEVSSNNWSKEAVVDSGEDVSLLILYYSKIYIARRGVHYWASYAMHLFDNVMHMNTNMWAHMSSWCVSDYIV